MLSKEKRWMILPLTLLGVGILFLIYGFINKEHLIVLQKATIICLECVGIG